MSATREHRNAGRVSDAIDVVSKALDVAADTYLTLAADLPDDFPPLDRALLEARERVQALARLAE